MNAKPEIQHDVEQPVVVVETLSATSMKEKEAPVEVTDEATFSQ